MAVRRSRAASGLLLSLALLGVARAQGSGSHDHTEPPHALAEADGVPVEVRGMVEVRSTTTAPAATTTEPSTTEPATTGPSTAAPANTAPEAEPQETTGPRLTSVDDPLVQDTLARISYPWRDRLPGWVVAFVPGRAGVHGLTFPGRRRIELYVRAGDTPAVLARVLAHELGHAVDVTWNDPAEREMWRRARGVGGDVPWWPDGDASDFSTLAGDFAEAFATWQTGAASQSTVAGPPTDEQLALLASLAN